MVETILQDFEREVKEKVEELMEELRENFDFAKVEQTLTEMLNRLCLISKRAKLLGKKSLDGQ